jgi:hypothetical protein
MLSCNICNNNYNKNNKFITSCNHTFCNQCITHWLLLNNTCPMCRHDIIDNNNDSDSDSDSDSDEYDYYLDWPGTNNYMSFNDLQNIRRNHRDDIYDICDEMIDDINENNLDDIHYSEKHNLYEIEDEIHTKQHIIYITFTYYPDDEKIQVNFTFKNKLKEPKLKQRYNYLNNRGKILNKINKINIINK